MSIIGPYRDPNRLLSKPVHAVWSLISLRKFHVNTSNCNKQASMRSSWTNIHNIMLKLCLNPNYKQVLGELSRPVSTGSTPGAQRFFLIQFRIKTLTKKTKQNKTKQSSSVRGKRHTTRVLWCTKFRHRLHDDEKVPYAHVTDLYWGNGPRAWQVAKYYERYFVHWFNDMVSWIFTPWKYFQLKQAKKSTLCK